MNNLRLQSFNDLLCRLFNYVDSTWSNSLLLFWLVAVLVCRHFGQDNLSPFWCRHFGVSPFWFVAILTIHWLWLQADERLYDAHPSGLLALTSQSRPSFKPTYEDERLPYDNVALLLCLPYIVAPMTDRCARFLTGLQSYLWVVVNSSHCQLIAVKFSATSWIRVVWWAF